MTIRIITDSGCDLEKSFLEDHGIEMMPIVLLDDEKEYYDKIDIDEKTLYDDMRKGKVYKTSQVPAKIMEETFKKSLSSNEHIIYLCFSSGLSGTYQTAIAVRSTLESSMAERLHIIDSKSATAGFSTIVYLVAKYIKENPTIEDTLKEINKLVEGIEHIFTVDNMDYLYRGGRVTKAQAMIGGVLNIKPVIEINEEGKLIVIDKVRGRNKSIKRIYEIVEERGGNLSKQLIGIAHGDDQELAEKVKEDLKEKYDIKDFLICNIGSAIGAHAGPGTLGITFYKNWDEE